MRNALSELITDSARRDPHVMVLSGDHGYALFDSIRKQYPDQFMNVGVMEQAMIGIAAGLCRQGYRPTVYGLSAFVPIRVLEQIKLDVCYPNLPVIFIGDGAGLVYSTLGVSHQCAEDVAALRALPNLRIYSPCDAEELRACYADIENYRGPVYLRIGKGDRPPVSLNRLKNAEPHFPVPAAPGAKACLVATGAMVSISAAIGRELGVPVMSVVRLRPMGEQIIPALSQFEELIVLEEHSRYGGLASSLAEMFCELPHGKAPRIRVIALQEKFAEKCGSHQYALSEHNMSDVQVRDRIKELLL